MLIIWGRGGIGGCRRDWGTSVHVLGSFGVIWVVLGVVIWFGRG